MSGRGMPVKKAYAPSSSSAVVKKPFVPAKGNGNASNGKQPAAAAAAAPARKQLQAPPPKNFGNKGGSNNAGDKRKRPQEDDEGPPQKKGKGNAGGNGGGNSGGGGKLNFVSFENMEEWMQELERGENFFMDSHSTKYENSDGKCIYLVDANGKQVACRIPFGSPSERFVTRFATKFGDTGGASISFVIPNNEDACSKMPEYTNNNMKFFNIVKRLDEWSKQEGLRNPKAIGLKPGASEEMVEAKQRILSEVQEPEDARPGWEEWSPLFPASFTGKSAEAVNWISSVDIEEGCMKFKKNGNGKKEHYCDIITQNSQCWGVLMFSCFTISARGYGPQFKILESWVMPGDANARSTTWAGFDAVEESEEEDDNNPEIKQRIPKKQLAISGNEDEDENGDLIPSSRSNGNKKRVRSPEPNPIPTKKVSLYANGSDNPNKKKLKAQDYFDDDETQAPPAHKQQQQPQLKKQKTLAITNEPHQKQHSYPPAKAATKESSKPVKKRMAKEIEENEPQEEEEEEDASALLDQEEEEEEEATVQQNQEDGVGNNEEEDENEEEAQDSGRDGEGGGDQAEGDDQ